MTTCILCGNATFSEIYAKKRLRVIRCKECGLARRDKCSHFVAAQGEELETIESYYENRSRTKNCPLGFDRDKIHRTRDIRQRIRNLLKDDGRLLDVGCGTGEFAWSLREAGINVIGVEPDSVRACYAAEKLDLQVVTSLYKQSLYAPGTFEAVTFIQVLEHMENPLDALRIANEHLKLDGLLVIDVPSFNNPRILAYRLTRLSRLVQHDFIPSHCYYFTRRTLSKLVEKAGFEVLKAQTGRYSVKFSENILTSVLDRVANALGIGGITLYARKA